MSAPTQIDLMDLSPFIAGTELENFAALREHDPLHWNEEPNGGPGFWSITRYADLITAIDDPTTYINGEGTQILSRKVEGHHPTVHNTDAPRHMELRRIATPHLRAVKIKDWLEIIDSNVDEILDSVQDRHDYDFVHNAAALLPIQVLGEVLGVPHEDGHLLLDWTNRVVSDDPEYMTTPDEKERARAEMFAYFKELTEERRKRPRHDIISILVQAKIRDEPLSWEDLAAYYFVLVGAGNETTRNLLTGSILAFHEHPDQWEILRRDPGLLGSGIEELIRYVTPIRAMRRTATSDVQWYGKTIRKGDKVVLWFQSANRDPEVFEAPDDLRVDRYPNEHVGFGWGVHSCMGSHLARAEANSFLGKMVERDLRIIPRSEPDRLHTNQFNAFKRLRVDSERA
ncbi:cytochrome P450 [Microbacterium sp. SLBN-111]|uniref:cytochrome P450 n=1 Tax=Microbacterium sp. SLBN-111 TaxID=3377733 RepID=UPI003C781F1E